MAKDSKSSRRVAKKHVKKNVQSGVAHIRSTFNNTIITITDNNGEAVSWCTSGTKGFKGSRKSTPFAAQVAADDAAHKAMDHGMRSVAVYAKVLAPVVKPPSVPSRLPASRSR